MYLPALCEVVAAAHEQTEAESGPMGHGELILLVDDESAILTTARIVLESAGYRVVTARDGADALNVYRNHPGEIRAVILDMMMPEMDGPTAMVELGKIDPAARVIAASGLRAGNREYPAGAVPPRAFLQKPYSEEDLLRTLAEVLRT